MAEVRSETERANTLKIVADMQGATNAYVELLTTLIDFESPESIGSVAESKEALLALRNHLQLQQHLLVRVNELCLEYEDGLSELMAKVREFETRNGL